VPCLFAQKVSIPRQDAIREKRRAGKLQRPRWSLAVNAVNLQYPIRFAKLAELITARKL